MPATITNGVAIKGEGAANEVTVTGAGTAVFGIVAAPGTSFANMTIKPTGTATAGAGTHGIN